MKSNAETSKSNKKSKGYGMKIAMAAGLGTLLVCGIVAIGLIAFGAGLLIGKIISGNIFFFAIIVIAIGAFILWDK